MLEPGFNPLSVVVRSFRDDDLRACRVLYREGLLAGRLAENDTGYDIDDIHSAYMHSDGDHFWVAVDPSNQIVGMIGVQQHEVGQAEIRRLRVRVDVRRRGVGSSLVETAVRFCNDHGCLKVALDTFVDREPAIKLFEKFHFRFARTKKFGEKELLYFYLDLYEGSDDRRSTKSGSK